MYTNPAAGELEPFTRILLYELVIFPLFEYTNPAEGVLLETALLIALYDTKLKSVSWS